MINRFQKTSYVAPFAPQNPMKTSLFLAPALAISLSLPSLAQEAPTGWKTQTKAGGAKTFTPLDLKAGESYSFTIYDGAPLGGKTLGDFLRGFAGTVGTQPGQLTAPLKIETQTPQAVSGVGTYVGPNGTRLTAGFNAFSFDGGKNVWVARVLTSSDAVFFRYKSSFETLVTAMTERAKTEVAGASPATSTSVQASNQPLSAWTTQQGADDSTIYTPPDLRAGEVYRATLSDTLRLKGRTIEEFLREYAGPVGKKAGELSAPLQVKPTYLRATATGTIVGTGGAPLPVFLLGVTADGINIRVMRIAYGSDALLGRYKAVMKELADGMSARAEREAGRNLVQVPERVSQHLKPGGEIKPGVYVGKQFEAQALKHRLRLHLYKDGSYQFKSDDDTAFVTRWGNEVGKGERGYDRNSGQLYLGSEFNMNNDTRSPTEDYCFYGLNSEGQPAIIAREGNYGTPINTSLVWSGPIPNPPVPPKPTDEQLREIAKKKKAEADKAEAERYKWVTAPGKGIQTAQIQTILAGTEGFGDSMTYTLYLLLKDGTVRKDLPVAPDEMNVVLSRRNEPKEWGKWRKTKDGFQVSWAGKTWEELPGFAVVPASAGQKVDGYYGWASTSGAGTMFVSSISWGTRYGINGRFEDSSSSLSVITSADASAPGMVSRSDDDGSSVMGAGPGYALGGDSTKKSTLSDRAGTYSINGYTITFRYENGRIVRRPFFFMDEKHENLWDGNRFAYLDKSK